MDGKVVDIQGKNTSAGAHLNAYNKNNPPTSNQLWYLDEQGFVKSALNNMTFSNQGKGHQLKMQEPDGNPRSQWRFEGNTLQNNAGEVMDIKGQSSSNNAELISFGPNGQRNQQWRQEFVQNF
jgi:hypothetical protein